MGRRGLVIFDCDGTLFRADAVTVPAVELAFREHGLGVPLREEITQFIGRPLDEFRAWLDEVCPPGVGGQVAEAVDRVERELVVETGELYPGVPEALGELRASVDRMAICTNGPKAYVEAVVAACDLGRFFDAIRHHRADGDTKTGMVRELLALFPNRPALVIGDRPEDIEAAHANGLPAIAVAYGMGRPEELARAEAVARSPADLPRLVHDLMDRPGS
jgi:phosphoglycolate phosphatase